MPFFAANVKPFTRYSLINFVLIVMKKLSAFFGWGIYVKAA